MPTVTSVSVTAKPVVFTFAVGKACAKTFDGASIAVAVRAAVPRSSLRRNGE